MASVEPQGGSNYPDDSSTNVSAQQQQASGGSAGLKTEQDFQKALGGLYDPTVYQDYLRNTSNNGGGDSNDWFNRIVAKNELRATNEPNSQYVPDNKGGYTVGPTGKVNYPNASAISGAQRAGTMPSGVPMPGAQFDDPYTKMLEQIAQNQLNFYQQPINQAPYDQYANFINQRFNELSQNPGYSPAELALLRTQSSEPIEAYRSASRQRALQHAASAGFLPTSGITDLTQGQNGLPETFDTAYDRMRVAADRDLAINALNRRTQDLNSALNLGNAGIQVENQRFGDQQQRNNAALQLATLLQQLPAESMNEALSVINGTASPSSLLGSVAQLTQQNRQNSFNNWANLGALFATLFPNGF